VSRQLEIAIRHTRCVPRVQIGEIFRLDVIDVEHGALVHWQRLVVNVLAGLDTLGPRQRTVQGGHQLQPQEPSIARANHLFADLADKRLLCYLVSVFAHIAIARCFDLSDF